MKHNSLMKLLRKIHEDENGTVSLETVLIFGAIAMVIVAFLYKVGWPWVKQLFTQGQDDITNSRDAATQ
jgi:Flp pilus assembly pilin Flp